MLTSHKKVIIKKHTIKNLVANELIRFISLNSEKLKFLNLQNNYFDILRNKGFRIYYLSKIFASVSYLSRNKYLLTRNKIYSNVVQERQAEAALIEVREQTFKDHLNNKDQEQTKAVGDQRTSIKYG